MDPSIEQLALMKELLSIAQKRKLPSSTDEFRYHLTLRGWKNVGSIPETTLQNLHSIFQQNSPKEKNSNETSIKQNGKCVVKIEPFSIEPSPQKNPTSPFEDWVGPGFQNPSQVPTWNGNQTNHHAKFPTKPNFTPKRNLNPNPAQSPNHGSKSSFKPNIPTVNISGTKRKATELPKSSQTNTDNHAKRSVDDFFCKTCYVNCSSVLTLNEHLTGRAHKAKLNWSKGSKSNLKCDLCEIFCSDGALLEMHYKGKKHQSKLKLIQEKSGENSVQVSKTIRCELCRINCMNEDLFEMHLNGKPHATRVEMKRRGLI